jgi:predicted nucleic-acid-binding protein
MIGLDTNVLARLFVDDDAAQARAARRFVADQCSPQNPGFVDRVALCELVWVLSGVHGYERSAIAGVIEELLASRDIHLEDDDRVRAALRHFAGRGVDFADALICEANRARGCDATVTFDRKAARLEGFVLVS